MRYFRKTRGPWSNKLGKHCILLKMQNAYWPIKGWEIWQINKFLQFCLSTIFVSHVTTIPLKIFGNADFSPCNYVWIHGPMYFIDHIVRKNSHKHVEYIETMCLIYHLLFTCPMIWGLFVVIEFTCPNEDGLKFLTGFD